VAAWDNIRTLYPNFSRPMNDSSPPRTRRAVLAAACAICLCSPAPSAGQSPPPEPVSCQPESKIVDDVTVTTASRVELCEKLINTPVTMSVLTSEVIGNAPSQNITDLMRLVPGVNTAQTSARDINLTLRGATGTLEDSTLVLLDGRSIYQDFFGFVMWDFIPVDPAQIKQIEIIRGPASAVWGANALEGVVNIITKTPRELAGSRKDTRAAGTYASIQFGQFDRTRKGDKFDGGGLFAINATHAVASSDRFAYKISGGLLTQEPLLRPTGTIPGTQTPYPSFSNRGTKQGRLDARADTTLGPNRTLVFSGGIAGTEGILHSGLGPLAVQSGSTFKYGRMTYVREHLKLQAFVNALDGEGTFLLQRGSNGQPLAARFENQVYDVEASHSRLLDRHRLSYGGNFRLNRFGLTMAPQARYRNEVGAYLQDTMTFLSDYVRWIVGARVDGFSVLDKTVFSPRTALIVKPGPNDAIRFSFNRAFRAPSLFNSFIDVTFLSREHLPVVGDFEFPSVAVGNRELQEESLTAYEVAYRRQAGAFTLGAAGYVNRTRNMILFTRSATYTSASPPPRWPAPPQLLDLMNASGQGLPSEFTYRNFDRIIEKGIELSLEARLDESIGAFANYTSQNVPGSRGFSASEINVPPRHRINAGASLNRSRYFGSVSASYQSEAFWQDVLDARYNGWTDSFTIVNAGAGVRSADQTMTIAVRVTNLLNRPIQQHVFGDLMKRTVIGEIRLAYKSQ
jgi:iron complex outermembrane receptor protein